jgi:fermentation-respiration switch protein FrsA (DUF1100 family)
MKTVGIAILFYTLYCALLFVVQRQMIFPRGFIAHQLDSPPGDINVDQIWLNTEESTRIESWYLPPVRIERSQKSPAVIFAHGNAELIDFCVAEMAPFTQLGIGVLLVEYPGYGRSEGSPSQKSITSALKIAYDMLASKTEIDSTKIIFYGRSLGGAAVCALAAERTAAAMILTSTFTSIRAMAIKYLAPSFLIRDPFDNLKVVRNFYGPLLIIHGRYDEIVPFRHGEMLHHAAKQSKLIVYECGHNDCPPDWNIFWRDIKAFLKTAGLIG